MTDTTISESETSNPALSEVEHLIGKSRLHEAQQLCGQVLRKHPDNPEALFWGGVLALEYRKFPDAAKFFTRAISLDTSRPEYHANLGRALVALRQPNEARKEADNALALEPDDARTLDTIGVIFSFAGDHVQAAEAFRRAVQIDAGRDSYWYNLATSLKFSGLFEEAEDAYNKALELNPTLDKALYSLSRIRTQTPESNHIEQLKQRLKDDSNSLNNEISLSYALAKEHDDIGAYADAFAALEEVNQRYRQSINYTFEDDACLFDSMLEGFDQHSINECDNGHDSARPVFIIGMPRSGTTLTDRILSAHSAVQSAGELNFMPAIIRLAAKAKSNHDLKPAIIRSILGSDLRQIGSKYLEAAEPLAGEARHFIDKLPINFFYAGFILLALPNARIICLRRNPLDTCLGNYRQLFTYNNMDCAYSYDLLECGRYYMLFDKLMRHWNDLFPNRIYNLQYEDLVDNQEHKTRELIDHVGLDWENQCLEFEKNAAPVATASNVQVREGLNRAGIDRWKNYEEQLKPLIDFFRDNGIEV